MQTNIKHFCVIEAPDGRRYVASRWPEAIKLAAANQPGGRIASCRLGHVDAPSAMACVAAVDAGRVSWVSEVLR